MPTSLGPTLNVNMQSPGDHLLGLFAPRAFVEVPLGCFVYGVIVGERQARRTMHGGDPPAGVLRTECDVL